MCEMNVYMYIYNVTSAFQTIQAECFEGSLVIPREVIQVTFPDEVFAQNVKIQRVKDKQSCYRSIVCDISDIYMASRKVAVAVFRVDHL